MWYSLKRILFPFVSYEIVSEFQPMVAVVLAAEGKVDGSDGGFNNGVGFPLSINTGHILLSQWWIYWFTPCSQYFNLAFFEQRWISIVLYVLPPWIICTPHLFDFPIKKSLIDIYFIKINTITVVIFIDTILFYSLLKRIKL